MVNTRSFNPKSSSTYFLSQPEQIPDAGGGGRGGGHKVGRGENKEHNIKNFNKGEYASMKRLLKMSYPKLIVSKVLLVLNFFLSKPASVHFILSNLTLIALCKEGIFLN